MTFEKPSVAKRTGAAFIALAVASAVAMPSLATSAQSAYADNTPQGNVTINATDANNGVTYNAYKLFNGNVQAGNKISNVTFVDEKAHDAVWKAITAADANYTDPASTWASATDAQKAESAQKAAEYIAQHISDTAKHTPSEDNTLIVGNETFAEALSKSCDDLTKVATLTPGTKQSMDEGYYLFTTTPDTIKTGKAGTSPIFAVVGAGDVAVTEKTSVPTLTKQVKDDSATEYGKAADAQRGQDVNYLLTGTVADNIASFDKYAYTFTDTADEGLDISKDSVKVFLHHAGEEASNHSNDVTKAFNVTLDKQTLTVSSDDIRKAGIGAIKGDFITVEYTAQTNGTTVQGAKGNTNTAKLTYSSDPQSTATADTSSDSVKTYAYTLQVHKQDLQNAERSLASAKMTLKVKATDEKANVGKYVQADGSLGDTPYEFTTDKDGNWTVLNLDQGTYTLTETTAPADAAGSQYDLLGDTDVVVGSNVADMAKQTADQQALNLTASVKAPDQTHSNMSTAVLADTVNADGTTTGSGIHSDTGIVHVVVQDASETKLPLTGSQFAIIGIGAVMAAVAAKKLRDQKKAAAAAGDEDAE